MCLHSLSLSDDILKIPKRIYQAISWLVLILEVMLFLLQVYLKDIFLVHFLSHIWIFMTDIIVAYIQSIILQLLMDRVVQIQALKSGLVSVSYLHTISGII